MSLQRFARIVAVFLAALILTASPASGQVRVGSKNFTEQFIVAEIYAQALEAAGRPVSRIVPEFSPDTGPLQLHVLGDEAAPQMVVTGALVKGVQVLPFSAAALSLLPAASPALLPGSAQGDIAEPEAPAVFNRFSPEWIASVAWALVARGARMVEYWHWHTLPFGADRHTV